MKIKSGLLALMLMVLMAGTASAKCGTCPIDMGTSKAHAGEMENCSMTVPGDDADILKQAASALHDSNHELSEKVAAIAKKCCMLGLHNKKSA